MAETKRITLPAITYAVRKSDRVLLTIDDDFDLQQGASTVRVVEDPTRRWKGDFLRHDIGSGSELIGFQIRIVTAIADLNPHTNAVHVEYEVRGGPGGAARVEKDEAVTDDGDIIVFIQIVRIVEA